MIMKFCRKLDLNFDFFGVEVDANNLRTICEYKEPQKYGLALRKMIDFISVPNSTYELKEEDKHKILAGLPKSLLDVEVPEVWVLNIQPTESDETTMLAPHVDKVRKCCINIYVDTHGERTSYYEYRAGKLEEKYSFVAKDGECWALDSEKPHSVLLSPPHIRKAISISFVHTPYSEIIKHLT